jgi:glutathione S-transferase
MITITAFERSPDGGKGLARDTRVRWALEEVGQPYEVRLVSFRAMKEPAHLALHLFGQIPTYEEGDLALFETGAIVFHIAERHAGLLPDDANARARAITWMFAALNTVEPPILDLVTALLLEGDKPWSKERMPLVEGRIRNRLNQLSARLGDAEWLDGAFSAGDLMMVSVLLRLRPSGILDEYPNLAAYVARGEARPAYERAFEAQLAVNKPLAGSWSRPQSEPRNTKPFDIRSRRTVRHLAARRPLLRQSNHEDEARLCALRVAAGHPFGRSIVRRVRLRPAELRRIQPISGRHQRLHLPASPGRLRRGVQGLEGPRYGRQQDQRLRGQRARQLRAIHEG